MYKSTNHRLMSAYERMNGWALPKFQDHSFQTHEDLNPFFI
jgi:hypothetical protein